MSAPFVETPSVHVTADLVATLVERGGYTHPLFNPEATDAPRPLPGQAVLLLMGGLAEQSGELDHAIALLEIGSVRFHSMVRSGTDLRVRITAGRTTPTSKPEKVVQDFTWTAVDADGELLAEAEVVMLVRATSPHHSEGHAS